jgi:hypothetical protein
MIDERLAAAGTAAPCLTHIARRPALARPAVAALWSEFILHPSSFILLLMLLCFPAFAFGGEREASQQVRRGLEEFRQGDFQAAAEAFAEADESLPQQPRIAFNRACAAAAAGQTQQAIDLFQKAALGRDRQLAAACYYNLGCLSAEQARARLGERPEEAAPEVRKEVRERMGRAAGHFRECLRVEADHDDARYNLETIRLWLKHIEAVWKQHDRQKRRDELNLLQFLHMLETQQRALRTAGKALARVPPSPKQRQEVRAAESAERELAEEIDTLKAKIRDALATPPLAGVTAPPPQADANVQKALEFLTALADDVHTAMQRAANRLADRSVPEALTHQTAAVEKLDQIFMAVAPFVNLVQKAIGRQQELVDQSSAAVKAAKDRQDKAADDNREPPQLDFVDAAWNQRFVAGYSRVLPAKAKQELERLESSGPPSPGGLPKAPDGGAAAPGAADPQAAEKQRAALERSFKKGIELAPKIETLTSQAAADLGAHQTERALPKQEEALKLLRQILPKLEGQQQQDQPQDQPKDQSPDRPKDQRKDQRTQQPRDLPKEQADAVLSRLRQRQQERREMEKEMQRLLFQPDKVDKDW